MTDDINLLPLPKWMSNYTIPPDSSLFHEDVILADRMRDYARANVLHHTAPLQAEIDALRAEVDALEAENERLLVALAAVVSWFPSADTYRRLGFDPKTPMQVLKEAKAVLFKENRDGGR